MLRVDQPGSGLRRRRDPGYRRSLYGRLAGSAGAGDAPDLEQALYHPRANRHRTGPGFQTLRPGPSAGRRGRTRYHLRADPYLNAGRGNWPSSLPAERTVPERPHSW